RGGEAVEVVGVDEVDAAGLFGAPELLGVGCVPQAHQPSRRVRAGDDAMQARQVVRAELAVAVERQVLAEAQRGCARSLRRRADLVLFGVELLGVAYERSPSRAAYQRASSGLVAGQDDHDRTGFLAVIGESPDEWTGIERGRQGRQQLRLVAFQIDPQVER